MDWYPLVVQDRGGKRWVTRAEDPFLEAGPFRGPDFTLAGAQHRWEKEARAESLLRDDAVPQVYVDMTPALQAFFSREG